MDSKTPKVSHHSFFSKLSNESCSSSRPWILGSSSPLVLSHDADEFYSNETLPMTPPSLRALDESPFCPSNPEPNVSSLCLSLTQLLSQTLSLSNRVESLQSVLSATQAPVNRHVQWLIPSRVPVPQCQQHHTAQAGAERSSLHSNTTVCEGKQFKACIHHDALRAQVQDMMPSSVVGESECIVSRAQAEPKIVYRSPIPTLRQEEIRKEDQETYHGRPMFVEARSVSVSPGKCSSSQEASCLVTSPAPLQQHFAVSTEALPIDTGTLTCSRGHVQRTTDFEDAKAAGPRIVATADNKAVAAVETARTESVADSAAVMNDTEAVAASSDDAAATGTAEVGANGAGRAAAAGNAAGSAARNVTEVTRSGAVGAVRQCNNEQHIPGMFRYLVGRGRGPETILQRMNSTPPTPPVPLTDLTEGTGGVDKSIIAILASKSRVLFLVRVIMTYNNPSNKGPRQPTTATTQ
eukprot:GHVQ01037247.1.p1 GENE.GHVQ01037247.1~~GHVQ01037247.1.p1  ORF type:complete len:465 (-),score=76.82 GHVQ01037247.1:697-2091(-)